jgi:hypothetical protein
MGIKGRDGALRRPVIAAFFHGKPFLIRRSLFGIQHYFISRILLLFKDNDNCPRMDTNVRAQNSVEHSVAFLGKLWCIIRAG